MSKMMCASAADLPMQAAAEEVSFAVQFRVVVLDPRAMKGE
jgi:hypothetical protein